MKLHVSRKLQLILNFRASIHSKQVTIKRDNFGTPHVYADNTFGLFYGYGYAVATDRLFQMEMSKRTGQGTVAEVLGADYLQYDIATHSRFNPENIKQQLALLSPEDRAIFEGYAAGFNQRIKESKNQRNSRKP